MCRLEGKLNWGDFSEGRGCLVKEAWIKFIPLYKQLLYNEVTRDRARFVGGCSLKNQCLCGRTGVWRNAHTGVLLGWVSGVYSVPPFSVKTGGAILWGYTRFLCNRSPDKTGASFP